MSGWEIQWGNATIPVEVKKRLATDSHGEMEVYMAECPPTALTKDKVLPLRGFGLDEDQAILDLYRDMHRRMT